MFLNANASPGSAHVVPDSLHSLQNFACKKIEFSLQYNRLGINHKITFVMILTEIY